MTRNDVVLFPPARSREHRAEPLLRHVVGHILREARKEQGRTLQDVARQARVSTPYLSEVERGRKEASSEVLAAICSSLGFGMVDLIGAAHEDLSAFSPMTSVAPAPAHVLSVDSRSGPSLPSASVSLMVA